MNKSKFFIAIGPPKTGTTWLYSNLAVHPEVELPRDKEIRYFWTNQFIGKGNLFQTLFNSHWHYKGKRIKFKSALKQHVRSFFKGKLNRRTLFSDLHYFCGSQTDRWYEKLFPDDVTSGDITPKYCELSEEAIGRIKALVPQARIIISLRDPIDREWSRVKMNLLKHKGKGTIANVSREEFLAHINEQAQLEANDYTALIEKWRKFFPPEQTLIFYYEELQENPQLLFDKVCDFLKISRHRLSNIDKKRNSGIRENIPDSFLKELAILNYPFIERFSKNHPTPYADRWREKYKAAVNSSEVVRK